MGTGLPRHPLGLYMSFVSGARLIFSLTACIVFHRADPQKTFVPDKLTNFLSTGKEASSVTTWEFASESPKPSEQF